MSEKFDEIQKKNAEFEKEAPYNFCDRWCERCDSEKQNHCRLYLDELDRRVTNIAHGLDEDDTEILEEDLRTNAETMQLYEEEYMTDDESYLTEEEETTYSEMERKMDQLHNHPLQKTVSQYMQKADAFLQKYYYEKAVESMDIVYDFETVAWYHTLLSAKMYRALCGLYCEEDRENDDFALCDAVAQLVVCKKAIDQSRKSLRKISCKHSVHKREITELLALLHNINSRIQIIEREI